MLCGCQLLPFFLKSRLQECLPEALMVHKWGSSSSEVIHFRAYALLQQGKVTHIICSVPTWQSWWNKKVTHHLSCTESVCAEVACPWAATKQNVKWFATEPSWLLHMWQTSFGSPGHQISISVKKTITYFKEKGKSIALHNCNQGPVNCIKKKRRKIRIMMGNMYHLCLETYQN